MAVPELPAGSPIWASVSIMKSPYAPASDFPWNSGIGITGLCGGRVGHIQEERLLALFGGEIVKPLNGPSGEDCQNLLVVEAMGATSSSPPARVSSYGGVIR